MLESKRFLAPLEMTAELLNFPIMINFENTEIAFQSKSSGELRHAYFLFKTLANQSFVKLGKNSVKLAQKIRMPIGWAVKPTIYKHFCGGETIAESMKIVQQLEQYHVRGILDYSVEGKDNEEDMKAAMEETLYSISNAAKSNNIPFAVFKPTAFAKRAVLEKLSNSESITDLERLEADNFRRRVDTLCQHAYNLNVPIMIDAEDVAFQNYVDEVVEEMMQKYNHNQAIVYNTLQMYRKDRLQFLIESYQKAVEGNYYLGIKFVRGAYMERERELADLQGYPSPIHDTKADTDTDFDAALQFSVEHIDRISIFCGTHNENSCKLLATMMKENNIAENDFRIYFAQLYGMSDNITYNLAASSYNTAKYVPYGPVKHVIPYLIRRAEENTAIAGQTSRELALIWKEKERRKNKK